MRITKISVKGLFGMFDHEIPLNQESRITIIHGPNGVGKTVLMRMVHGLFHHDYEYIGEIPFEELRIFFDQGRSISVEKLEDNDSLSIICSDETGSDYTPFTPRYDATEVELGMYMHNEEPNLSLVASGDKQYWWDRDSITLYTQEDILNKYPAALLTIYGEVPQWFVHARQNAATDFIPIERLRSDEQLALFVALRNAERNENPGVPVLDLPVLQEYSFRLEAKLNDPLSLPKKLIEDLELNLTPATQKIVAATEKLSDATTSEQIAQARKEARNARKSADKKWKIHSFREAAFRRRYQAENESSDIQRWDKESDMFQEVINERILYKRFSVDTSVDTNERFIMRNDGGEHVPIESLSSGEQHLIILFYKLLFETGPDTLVMIDEPEISMNVVWQRNFLKDLQRITELRNFDVLIATHSPQIIHDKWDWMVPLGAKVDDQ